MPVPDDQTEEALLRSVALQNAQSILLARQRAEEALLRAREALRESQERLRAALGAAGMGTFRWDVRTNALDWDENLVRLFGLAPGQTIRSLEQMFEAVHAEDRPRLVEASERCAREGSDLDVEFRVGLPDGTVRWIHDKGRTVRAADGRPLYVTGACVDVTERQRLLESERAARSAAERLSDVKDEFLATLSHELRTPLSAIVGWAQLLRRGPRDQADLLKGLDTIERNARVQTQLIEDLLDMSRIASGKMRLDIQPIHPASFIEEAVETLQHAADAKGIVVAKILDPLAGPLAGDPSRLQQVIWNLLSNAIKFTPRGGKIQVLLERVSSHVEISVADTGVGIKPEFIAHLFERFRQADPTTTRKYGGLGLGLSIVKQLVELHGGTVRVSSAGEGLGTTVAVHLPLMVVHRSTEGGERLHPKAAGSIPPGFLPADLSGIRVLVVDDQADARDLIRRVLEDCGAQVLTADSADEALPMVEAGRPDVLVSDIGMPGADGYELLRRVRELGPNRGGRVPAIALTAFARSEDRTRALRTGFLVHVSKPVDPSELIATVASVAGRIQIP